MIGITLTKKDLIKKYKNVKIFQILESDIKLYKNVKNKIIILHANYNINLAKKWTHESPHINQIIYSINTARKYLNCPYYIVHTGNSTLYSVKSSLKNLLTALLYIASRTDIKILLETSAGQGTELLSNLYNYCNFLKLLTNNSNINIRSRFGACIDTQHLYSAGYCDYTEWVDIIKKNLGFKYVRLCHFNDSMVECGKKIDRHANIENGMIPNINKIYKFIKQLNIPIILETPDKWNDYIFIKNNY